MVEQVARVQLAARGEQPLRNERKIRGIGLRSSSFEVSDSYVEVMVVAHWILESPPSYCYSHILQLLFSCHFAIIQMLFKFQINFNLIIQKITVGHLSITFIVLVIFHFSGHPDHWRLGCTTVCRGVHALEEYLL